MSTLVRACDCNWSVRFLWGSEFEIIVKELFPEKALVKTFAQPTVQKRFHSGLLNKYLLFNVRYYVVSDCGITHEIQSRIYHHHMNTKSRLNSCLPCKTTVY